MSILYRLKNGNYLDVRCGICEVECGSCNHIKRFPIYSLNTKESSESFFRNFKELNNHIEKIFYYKKDNKYSKLITSKFDHTPVGGRDHQNITKEEYMRAKNYY
jgi:hypothetical protein